MTQAQWSAVDQYIVASLVREEPVLATVRSSAQAQGLPPHDVSPPQGKFLHLLAQIIGARNILEIGTLAGYSTIWLGRALQEGGRLITLEFDPKHAKVARQNIERANLSKSIEVRVGAAIDSLQMLHQEGAGPFDLIFIDADKPNNPAYLSWALRLSRPGTVIIADNVVRDGAVVNAANDDPRVQGVRALFDMIAAEDKLEATALQTVGSKGWDGFAIAVVGRKEPLTADSF